MASTPGVRANHGWIWYFAILAALTLLATSILVWYNLAQQLKPEQLAAARQQWKEKGPRNYHLVYDIKIYELSSSNRCDVTVENGRVIQAQVNGLPEPANRFQHYGMEKLFSFIDTNLEHDQKKGEPRTYTRAIFDPSSGALMWYVRRVMGSKERVEIVVEKLETK